MSDELCRTCAGCRGSAVAAPLRPGACAPFVRDVRPDEKERTPVSSSVHSRREPCAAAVRDRRRRRQAHRRRGRQADHLGRRARTRGRDRQAGRHGRELSARHRHHRDSEPAAQRQDIRRHGARRAVDPLRSRGSCGRLHGRDRRGLSRVARLTRASCLLRAQERGAALYSAFRCGASAWRARPRCVAIDRPACFLHPAPRNDAALTENSNHRRERGACSDPRGGFAPGERRR